MQPIVDLKLEGNEQVKYALEHYGVAAQKALKRTVRKLLRHLNYKAKRNLGRNLKVPQKELKKRLLSDLHFNKDGSVKARLWFGANPIPFHHLGALHQLRSKGGVRAGKHFAKGAFVYNGLVFKRKSQARFPIKRVDLKIDTMADRALEQAGLYNQAQIQRKFQDIFNQELNFAVGHE